VWRYGLGRVAALTTFSGENSLGALLSRENSQFIVRVVNWAVGNPQRKKDYYVDVPDTRIYAPTEVFVQSPSYPAIGDLVFYKVEDNSYLSEFVPDKKGFQELEGAEYAVNYEREFSALGNDPEFYGMITSSGGRVFRPDDAEGMLEYARTRARRLRVTKVPLSWIFVIIAMVVYFIEVVIRRLIRTFGK